MVPDTEYTPSQLGIGVDKKITIYIEGVDFETGQNESSTTISVEVDVDGSGSPSTVDAEDTVKVQLYMIYEENFGNPESE